MPSEDVGTDTLIREKFHDQVRQHGPALLSHVAEQLGAAPPAISITLERVEFPPSVVNWAWFVGTTEPATEQAMLRFFQTEQGKRALIVEGPDPLEFKLASTMLRLPNDPNDNLALPDGLRVADTPLVDGQQVGILTGSTNRPVHVVDVRLGWLQTSPRMELSQVLHLHVQPEGQNKDTHGQALDNTVLRGWLVGMDGTTAYGRVVGIVGAQSVLVAPLLENVLTP